MATDASLRCFAMHHVAERTPEGVEVEGAEAEYDRASAVAARVGCVGELTHSF